ncbi:MAG: class I SAM-dependent methyltransferase [Planctomycetes bacterium]|nr:class I SAM-dependent methyltransferase [Planctomycetota bacterium]
MSRGSTSLHGLNADRGLPLPAKPLYFLLNRLNNLFPMSRLDPGLAIRPFTPSPERLGAAVPETVISPARVLTHLYWQGLPWPEIQRELGGIRVLDVGCGRADYAAPLLDWSGGRIERYLGVDAETHPEWDVLLRDRGPFAFARGDASEISRHLAPETSIILSSSALEHVDRDLGFFEQVRDHAARCGDGPCCSSTSCLPAPACACFCSMASASTRRARFQRRPGSSPTGPTPPSFSWGARPASGTTSGTSPVPS